MTNSERLAYAEHMLGEAINEHQNSAGRPTEIRDAYRRRASDWANVIVALRMHPGAIPSPPAKRKRELQLDEHDHGVE
jgi:hypothetical protein